MQQILDQLGDVLNTRVENYQALAGGDISSVYRVQVPKGLYLLKVNNGPNAKALLQAEQQGLGILSQTKTIGIPKVLHFEGQAGQAWLLMDYIENKRVSATDFANLGRALANLHQQHNDQFGLDQANFIGSLRQSNAPHQNWASFYVAERLVPQIKMAHNQGLLAKSQTPDEGNLLFRCEALFPDVKPSLLHGDLWNGNFLIRLDGQPFLIDPAVYYGHFEVDLAMSKLFGGFGPNFYDAYNEVSPPQPGLKERIDIYQLYYLLVHLNLFGASYHGSVVNIFNRYFT